jgi:fructokinase
MHAAPAAPATSERYGGVETGGTWCVCAVGRGPGELDALEEFPTGEPDETIARIAAFFQREGPVAALGVGAFGPLDLREGSPTWGHVTTTPKRAWREAALGPRLREALGVPVAFDTDVNAAALGEHRWGAGRGADSLLYLTVGTGIGGGLLLDGRPRHGLVHPEVGHLRIPHDGSFAGVCPSHGDCLEGLASGPAIAARWGTAPEELPDGHPAWELEAEQLALGILAVVMVASPERVIVGGGVLNHAPLLGLIRRRLPALLNGYLRSSLLAEAIEDYLVAPALGDRAGVLGAIALAERISGRS